jgi:multidrug efflux pump subunit AcrB
MRGLAAFSVRQWQFTLVIFAMLAAMGVNAFLTIPRAEDPSFPVPTFTVIAVLPGADPLDMEKLVAKPVEDALDGLDDVDKISSTSRDGVTTVQVEFSWGSDPDRKHDEVVREVNAIRPTLPDALVSLEVRKNETSYTNIVQMALVSDTASGRELQKRSKDLKDAIERVPGVRKAEVWGEDKPQVRVALDLGRMATLGLPASAVADALKAEGLSLPLGAIHAGERRFTVKGTGDYKTIDEIGDTVVRAAGGRTVRVRDVAEVSWQAEEPSHLTTFNGRRAVFVTANMKAGGNVFPVRDGIYQTLDAFAATLPPDIVLERGFDQSRNVDHRLSSLFRDFAIALGLVLLTLLPLGFRASAVVMLSIPLSLAIGVTLLQLTGFTLNQLSIAGFVLALGLLVDDSIVVTENIARHLREGASRTEAAIGATSQITVAVIGCTATLIFAFLPLLFLPEGAGKFIRSLPVTVLYTVAASLFVSLTIIPFLASRMLARDGHGEGNAVLRVVMRGIHGIYRPLLHVALMRPVTTTALAMALFGASLMLVPRLGFSLFPPAETPQFLIEVNLPNGASVAETAEAVRFVDAEAHKTPNVVWTMANAGHGNPRIYYNVPPRDEDASHGAVYVSFDRWDPQESPRHLDDLRQRLAAYPGAQIIVRVFQNGPPIEAPVAIRIVGPEVTALKDLAASATRIIEATPGARDVVNPLRLDRTDLDLGVDTGKAAVLGIPAGAVDRAVRLAFAGETVAQFTESNGDKFPVVVRLPFGERHELGILKQIYVPTAGGATPLAAVTEPRFGGGPARIDRYKRERSVTITAYTETGYNTGRVTQEVLQRLQALPLPPGYRISVGGEAEAQSRSFAGLGNAILIATFGILAILILEFRSFKASAVVAGVIPLGVVGGLGGLWLAGYTLSFTAVIGFIALIGIEIKNSILLVDFTSQLRRAGVPLREAIEQAGEVRFLPVLLTSATAIGGLLPLAIEGSGLYSPLAVVIIGGLVTSTFLSRLVTPAMYLLLAPKDDAAEAVPATPRGMAPLGAAAE